MSNSWRTTGLTLDTGALIALDHPASAILMQARLDEALRRGGAICIPAGVVAQAWRGARQVRLARLIRSRDVDIAVMTRSVARTVGQMCADSGHADIVERRFHGQPRRTVNTRGAVSRAGTPGVR